MKKILTVLVVTLSLVFVAMSAQAQQNQNGDIEKLIFAYRDALNASDAEKVVSLFAPNGVLLANTAPTAAGVEQVKGTYNYVFSNFKYNL